MLNLQPDPEAPIYESVRLGAEMRKRGEDAGYALGRGLTRFAQFMNAWASGLANAQAEAAAAMAANSEDAGESDDDDHYA